MGLGLYAWVLSQRVYHAKAQVNQRLKDVVAAVHRRIDEYDSVLNKVMRAMPDEKALWEEFVEAKGTLLQAMAEFDVNRIATADAELDRAEHTMRERIKAHPELDDHEEIIREMDDMAKMNALFEQQVRTYNQTVDEFNALIASFPTLIMAQSLKVRRASHFMLDQVTVADRHLEAIVLE